MKRPARVGTPAKPIRNASHAEHVADMLSHYLALFVVLVVVLPLLLTRALDHGAPWWTLGVSVFGISMALLYLASTLYHGYPYQRSRRERFRTLDQMAIFLLIAGTYTPFSLGAMRGVWGWALMAMVWTLAIVGIALKATNKRLFDRVAVWLYVGMGWSALLLIVPIWNMLPAGGLLWLLLGGIAYTIGVFFFIADHKPFYHFVWHVFVAIGSACHVVAVLNYSAG